MNRRLRALFVFIIFALSVCLGSSAHFALLAQSNEMPAQPAPKVQFAFGGNAAEIPAEFDGNLIFLPVRVNQSQPSLFLLDSTADASSIDPGRAKELGIAPNQAAILNLNGVDIQLPSLPASAKPDFGLETGRAYEGTLGSDFFKSVVVEIDYARRTVRLYDPGVYKHSGQGTAIHLDFAGRIPVAPARFSVPKGKDLRADFLVNTALDASTVISEHYAEAHRILTSHFKTIPIAGLLAGGWESAEVGRLKEFQLDRYAVQGSLAIFTQRELPQVATASIAGEIGGGLLRRFTVVLDCPHQQMILDPNSHFGEEDEEDKSGISVVAEGTGLKTFEIVQVAPGTPAAEAGLRKGDMIAGVDKDPAANLTLFEIRDLFRQAGYKYNLLVGRDGMTREVAIQTRRLLE